MRTNESHKSQSAQTPQRCAVRCKPLRCRCCANTEQDYFQAHASQYTSSMYRRILTRRRVSIRMSVRRRSCRHRMATVFFFLQDSIQRVFLDRFTPTRRVLPSRAKPAARKSAHRIGSKTAPHHKVVDPALWI